MNKEIDSRKHFRVVIIHCIIITLAFIEASLVKNNKASETFFIGVFTLAIYAPVLLYRTVNIWGKYTQKERNALLFFTSLPIIELVVLIMEGK